MTAVCQGEVMGRAWLTPPPAPAYGHGGGARALDAVLRFGKCLRARSTTFILLKKFLTDKSRAKYNDLVWTILFHLYHASTFPDY